MVRSSEKVRANTQLGLGGEPPQNSAPSFLFMPERPPAISGVSALFLIAFAVGVLLLARWAGQPASEESSGRTIQGLYGFIVAVALAALILVYGWIHRLSPSVAKPRSTVAARLGIITAPLGKLLTFFDHALVFGVAQFCGAGETTPTVRGLQFLAFFGGALLLAFLLPPPFGLSGVVLALLGILGLTRKWAWVEEDRRRYLLSGDYEFKNNSNISVGFEHNYRGVALTALSLIIFVMPLALMQTSAFGFFELKDGGDIRSVGTAEWFIFFGGELAKSVPFVDWSEVYGAETVTPLKVVHGGGQHMVFFVRAVVDLILLAGLSQVLDLSGRLSRQEDSFRDPNNPERILDPFLERDAFKDIAKYVVPQNTTELETDLVGELKARLGPFTSYSTMQIQRVLRMGEAPPYWLPDHETAMAIILPHREGNNQPPQYFTRIITEGKISEINGARVEDRDAHEQTRIAAILSTLSTSKPAFVEFKKAVLPLLPTYLESSDERVWSGAACGIAAIRSDAKFPDEAPGCFARALAEGDDSDQEKRSVLLHATLGILANTKRPSGDGEPRPHLNWAARLLITEVDQRQNDRILRSAVKTIGEIEFRPGEILNSAQKSLAALHEKASRHSLRTIFQFGRRRRLRRLAQECLAAVSQYESKSAPSTE